MLNLDTQLTIDEDLIQSPNLVDRFSKEDLSRISSAVWEGYNRDKQSRDRWEARNSAAMDLAMQIQKAKSFPWQGASNVAFPLITIAVTQFHARAYPSIISGPELVKYRVIGSDPDGTERARAERVGLHMSWQCLEQDTDWESQHDRLLINLAVIGSAFKKSYYSASSGHVESDLVMARDLVLDYYATSVESCLRKTHIIPLYRNEVYERVKRGLFADILEEPWYLRPSAPMQTRQDVEVSSRAGISPPQPDEATPLIFLEQHCWMDFDKDGYAEPYIVTIEEASKTVVRIVARFEQLTDVHRNSAGDIIKIRATEYFTKYTFLPSPDGGIYDLGFGALLGPLNESTNSLINQLIDAGTMSNAAGGFLGRGAKLRGGVYSFAPFSWQRVDSTGDDLRKSIFPLPVREPSQVLFALLNLLISYTNRISGSTDIMVGESVGQNTPADTARQMQSEGMKIYNAIFKRIWNSMKEEFRKIYILNSYYLPEQLTFGADGVTVSREDYLGDPTRIAPVADPTTTTLADRIQQAMLLKQAAMTTPGYNTAEVERLYLKALNIPNIDLLYNPEQFPPGEDVKIQLKKMDLERARMQLQADLQKHIMSLQVEVQLNQAKILELQARAASQIHGLEADQVQQSTEMFKATIQALTSRNDLLMQQIQQHTTALEGQIKQLDLMGKMVDYRAKTEVAEAKAREARNKAEEPETKDDTN